MLGGLAVMQCHGNDLLIAGPPLHLADRTVHIAVRATDGVFLGLLWAQLWAFLGGGHVRAHAVVGKLYALLAMSLVQQAVVGVSIAVSTTHRVQSAGAYDSLALLEPLSALLDVNFIDRTCTSRSACQSPHVAFVVVDISVRTTHGGQCLSLTGDRAATGDTLLGSAVHHRSLEDVFAAVQHLHLTLAVVHTAVGSTHRLKGEEAHILAVLGRLAVLV